MLDIPLLAVRGARWPLRTAAQLQVTGRARTASEPSVVHVPWDLKGPQLRGASTSPGHSLHADALLRAGQHRSSGRGARESLDAVLALGDGHDGHTGHLADAPLEVTIVG
jgi:hypothetical protein